MNKTYESEIKEMTNEEYRAELHRLLEEVEDEKLLHDFFTYVKRRQESSDCHVLEFDYRNMIIEMVGKIEDERLLRYFYVYMSEKLKRARVCPKVCVNL